MASARVVVVGGGLSGLAAAVSLAGSGHEVVVLEREERAGGRATSATEKGVCYEPGAHALRSSDRRLLALVERAGLAAELLPLRPLLPGHVLRDGGVRFGDGPDAGLGRLHAARLERLLRRFGSRLDAEAPELAEGQDDRSVYDFARLYFGRRVLEGGLGSWLAAEALCRPERTSRVLALLGLAGRHAWIGALRGDLERLPQALARRAAARLAHEACALEPGVGGGLRVHHRGPAGEASLDAEAVVLAVPARDAVAIAGPLLSTPEREALGATRTQAALALAVGLDAPAWRHAARIGFTARPDWPLARVVLEPGVPGGRVPEGHGLALVLTPERGDDLDAADERVASRLLPLLERMQSGASSRVAWTRVSRHPHALPCFDVGRYRTLARLRRVEADQRARGRRLYLAGDYLVGPTLEAAVVSGERAAAALARDLA